jgi:hypothetical protein
MKPPVDPIDVHVLVMKVMSRVGSRLINDLSVGRLGLLLQLTIIVPHSEEPYSGIKQTGPVFTVWFDGEQDLRKVEYNTWAEQGQEWTVGPPRELHELNLLKKVHEAVIVCLSQEG